MEGPAGVESSGDEPVGAGDGAGVGVDVGARVGARVAAAQHTNVQIVLRRRTGVRRDTSRDGRIRARMVLPHAYP